jgi:hypothetical protein
VDVQCVIHPAQLATVTAAIVSALAAAQIELAAVVIKIKSYRHVRARETGVSRDGSLRCAGIGKLLGDHRP